MSERAVELLCLPEDQPCYLLDVGYVCIYMSLIHTYALSSLSNMIFTLIFSCGSGLSGDYLTEVGHYWVGVDISTAMLGK